MSSLFRVTIFPHGLCIIRRRNQNHVLHGPAFKPEAAAVKVRAQHVVWAGGGTQAGNRVLGGATPWHPWLRETLQRFRCSLGASPISPWSPVLVSNRPACLLCLCRSAGIPHLQPLFLPAFTCTSSRRSPLPAWQQRYTEDRATGASFSSREGPFTGLPMSQATLGNLQALSSQVSKVVLLLWSHFIDEETK